MFFKKLIGYIHLWLGLASGLVVFIVAITGAIYVFQEEIDAIVNRHQRFVEAKTVPHAPLSVWLDSANKAFSKFPHQTGQRSFYWYKNSNHAVIVGAAYLKEKEENYAEAWLNPYTGQLIKVKEEGELDFWHVVIDLHINLMLGEVGGQIVHYATLIFLIMLISGIILWWPKNKNAAKQRFWFRWKEGLKWRRKNYDLHNISGFYASWIVVFMAITGLVWSFSWFDNGLYFMLSGGRSGIEPEKKEINNSTKTNVSQLELAYNKLKHFAPKEYKMAERFYISYPSDTSGTIYTYMSYNPPGIIETDYKYFIFDRATLTLNESSKERSNAGDWFRDFNGSIHYGSIFGFPSKLIVFFACLIAASLPITGFYIWWGRKRKKQKKRPIINRDISSRTKTKSFITVVPESN